VSEAMADALENSSKKEGVGEFIRETREELKRTSFPSSEDVRNTTIIVIVSVIFFAIYLFLVDHAWTYLLQGLTWLVNKLAGF
jgi:preprotein translocase SecE subunit